MVTTSVTIVFYVSVYRPTFCVDWNHFLMTWGRLKYWIQETQKYKKVTKDCKPFDITPVQPAASLIDLQYQNLTCVQPPHSDLDPSQFTLSLSQLYGLFNSLDSFMNFFWPPPNSQFSVRHLFYYQRITLGDPHTFISRYWLPLLLLLDTVWQYVFMWRERKVK